MECDLILQQLCCKNQMYMRKGISCTVHNKHIFAVPLFFEGNKVFCTSIFYQFVGAEHGY